MIRACVLLLILSTGVAALESDLRRNWPLRATVTDLHGRPVAFQALTRGGDLIIQIGQQYKLGRGQVPEVRRLAPRDTLHATTPASYPLDLSKGPIVFFTHGGDSIRVVVQRNWLTGPEPVTAEGRRLAIRLSDRTVVIDAR